MLIVPKDDGRTETDHRECCRCSFSVSSDVNGNTEVVGEGVVRNVTIRPDNWPCVGIRCKACVDADVVDGGPTSLGLPANRVAVVRCQAIQPGVGKGSA